jgi:hypothetical protein
VKSARVSVTPAERYAEADQNRNPDLLCFNGSEADPAAEFWSLHCFSDRAGWPDVVLAFHDADAMGPKMLARITKHTGLQPQDL